MDKPKKQRNWMWMAVGVEWLLLTIAVVWLLGGSM